MHRGVADETTSTPLKRNKIRKMPPSPAVFITRTWAPTTTGARLVALARTAGTDDSAGAVAGAGVGASSPSPPPANGTRAHVGPISNACTEAVTLAVWGECVWGDTTQHEHPC